MIYGRLFGLYSFCLFMVVLFADVFLLFICKGREEM